MHSRVRHGRKNILLLGLLTLGFYLVALASVLVSDKHSAWLEKLGNLREFLAAPFIGLLLLDIRVSTRSIMLTIKISALLVFMLVFYQLLTGTGRPGGAVNPLVFAVLSLLLGFFSIIRFTKTHVPQRWRVSMSFRPAHRLPGRLHGHLNTSSGKLRA